MTTTIYDLITNSVDIAEEMRQARADYWASTPDQRHSRCQQERTNDNGRWSTIDPRLAEVIRRQPNVRRAIQSEEWLTAQCIRLGISPRAQLRAIRVIGRNI